MMTTETHILQVLQILCIVYKMIAVTLIMLYLMTEQNAGTLMVSFCFKLLTLSCDTGDNIIDAGITNNDTGHK